MSKHRRRKRLKSQYQEVDRGNQVTQLGPAVDRYDIDPERGTKIYAWCPDQHAQQPPEQVHFAFNIEGLRKQVLLRFKSPESLGFFIEELTEYRRIVWADAPPVAGEPMPTPDGTLRKRPERYDEHILIFARPALGSRISTPSIKEFADWRRLATDWEEYTSLKPDTIKRMIAYVKDRRPRIFWHRDMQSVSFNSNDGRNQLREVDWDAERPQLRLLTWKSRKVEEGDVPEPNWDYIYDDQCLRYIDYLRSTVERVRRGEKEEVSDEQNVI